MKFAVVVFSVLSLSSIAQASIDRESCIGRDVISCQATELNCAAAVNTAPAVPETPPDSTVTPVAMTSETQLALLSCRSKFADCVDHSLRACK